MKKIPLLIIAALFFAITISCKKNEAEAVPKIKKMQTLLSQEWKLSGYYHADSQYVNGYPIIITTDYFQLTGECLRNSPVVFNSAGTGSITSTCNPAEITTEWEFSPDSVNFFFKWSSRNLSPENFSYRFQTFCADSIVMEQADTIENNITHYLKRVLVLKKN